MAIALIDTNVIVYAYDRGEPDKQKQAVRLLERLQDTQTGRLSTQVLAEFFSAVTRSQTPILSVPKAGKEVANLAAGWPILVVTPAIIQAAAQGVHNHHLSYYDAQLWATALLNQVPVIFSEDFASGSTLEGVRLVNPFAPQFKLADWQ
jgi:predicted nucleic acid-binding protein